MNTKSELLNEFEIYTNCRVKWCSSVCVTATDRPTSTSSVIEVELLFENLFWVVSKQFIL